jgi:hypothetical protein
MPVKYFIAKSEHYNMCLNLYSLHSYFWDILLMPAFDNNATGFGFCIQVLVCVQPGLFLQILDEQPKGEVYILH